MKTHNLIANGSGRKLKLEHVPTGKIFAYCNVPAPASKRCSKACACALPAGHTTDHRSRCGTRWKIKRVK
jgi:hypothetical protein